jgi:hypothetical protein
LRLGRDMVAARREAVVRVAGLVLVGLVVLRRMSVGAIRGIRRGRVGRADRCAGGCSLGLRGDGGTIRGSRRLWG